MYHAAKQINRAGPGSPATAGLSQRLGGQCACLDVLRFQLERSYHEGRGTDRPMEGQGT